jgi:membrane protease YdiL (CAAX protease family)
MIDPAALLAYGTHVAPAVAAGAAFLCVVPRRLHAWRLAAYLIALMALRDAMTPLGIWTIGPTGALRFTFDAVALVGLGLLAVAVVGLLQTLEPGLRPHLCWFERKRAVGVGLGLLGAMLIAAPLLAARQQAGVMGVMPPMTLVAPTLVLALGGALLEETLFRGWFQGLAAQELGAFGAAWASAALFALCHAPLAIATTGHGWPVVGVTFYIGAVCAGLRMRWGLVPAVLAHGLGIFALAAGP